MLDMVIEEQSKQEEFRAHLSAVQGDCTDALADSVILQKQTKDGVCEVNASILGLCADFKALNMLLAAGQDRKMDVDTDIALSFADEGVKKHEGRIPAPVSEDPLGALLAELASPPSSTLVSLPLVEAFQHLFEKDVGHPKAELELRLRLMTAIGKCSTLKSIQLDPLKRRYYRVTRPEARALLGGLCSNKVVECLDLSGYHGFGTGAACKALAVTLQSSRTLQVLNMVCTGLGADGLSRIAAALRDNGSTVLRILILDENTVIGGGAAQHLDDIQTSSPALRVLAIRELGLDGAELSFLQGESSQIAGRYPNSRVEAGLRRLSSDCKCGRRQTWRRCRQCNNGLAALTTVATFPTSSDPWPSWPCPPPPCHPQPQRRDRNTRERFSKDSWQSNSCSKRYSNSES